MKTSLSSFCHILVAVVILLVSGFATAQVAAQPSFPRPLIAQAQAYVTDTPGNPQNASSFETNRAAYTGSYTAVVGIANRAAYVEVIVIPLLLFILMVGVVRSRRV